jgi:microcin C transport system substrate-binding protein
MKTIRQYPVILFVAAACAGLAGCGRKSGQPAVAAPAAEGKPAAASGSAQAWPGMEADLQRTLREEPNFYKFKTMADFAKDTQGLAWEDGNDLPEFADPKARKGGTLTEWIADFPTTFRTSGPNSNGPFREYLLDSVALSLVEPHPDLPGKFYAELATAWALDRPHKTIYFKLDPAAKWSDGVPITADDYVFEFYFGRSPVQNSPFQMDYFHKTFDRLTVYDAHTIAITLQEWRPDALSRASVTPAPKHFFKDLAPGWEQTFNWRIAPTTGAYTVREEDIKKQVSVTLTRIPDWWARDKRFLRGRWNPDKVRLVVIRDPDKAFEAFTRGDLDIFPLQLPNLWYDKLPDTSPAVADGYIVKAKFFNRIPCPDMGLWINESKPGLSDPNVRMGIEYATNFDLVCKQYFRGDAVRQQSHSDGYGWNVNPAVSARPFDPQKAREYFAKAGYTHQGPDGILRNDRGEKLSFTITAYIRMYADLLAILQQEAMKAGLDFKIEVLDQTTGVKKLEEKQHDIAIMGFNRFVTLFPEYWESFSSDNAYDKAFNADGSVNPDRKVKPYTNNLSEIAIYPLDQLIKEYDKAETMDEVKSLASRIEKILDDDAGWVNGWKLPFWRIGYVPWLRWPADFNPMQARDFQEFWLMWIDQDAEKADRAARSEGKPLPKQVLTFDKFKD